MKDNPQLLQFYRFTSFASSLNRRAPTYLPYPTNQTAIISSPITSITSPHRPPPSKEKILPSLRVPVNAVCALVLPTCMIYRTCYFYRVVYTILYRGTLHCIPIKRNLYSTESTSC